MYRCATCGGQQFDAAGRCLNCGTPYQAGQPASGGPAYPVSGAGQGFPTSGPPGGFPTSGGPSYGNPYPSPVSATPASPAPYGQSPQPQAPKRNALTTPLIVMSVALVVVVIAIVAVVVVRSGSKNTAGPGTGGQSASPSKEPSHASNVDGCVVGEWKVDDYSESFPIEGYGTVTFKGNGAKLKLGGDGSGTTDYGSGTRFESTANGHTLVVTAAGTLTYKLTAQNSTISFSEMQGSGTVQLHIDGKKISESDLTGDNDPAQYTCAGDTLRVYTKSYEMKANKVH